MVQWFDKLGLSIYRRVSFVRLSTIACPCILFLFGSLFFLFTLHSGVANWFAAKWPTIYPPRPHYTVLLPIICLDHLSFIILFNGPICPSLQVCLFRYHFDPGSYWFLFVSTVAGTLFIREESAKEKRGKRSSMGLDSERPLRNSIQLVNVRRKFNRVLVKWYKVRRTTWVSVIFILI